MQHAHNLRVQLRLLRATYEQQLATNVLVERVGQLRKAFWCPAPRRAVTTAARMHGDDRACCLLRGLVVEDQAMCGPAVLLTERHGQPLLVRSTTYRFGHRQTVFGLVHGSKALVWHANIEEPAVAVIQANAVLRARCSHQCLELQPAEEKRQVMHQQHCVVMTAAQVAQQRAQLKQIQGIGQELFGIVEEILVQHNNAIDHFPTVQYARRRKRHKQIDLGLRVALAQGAQGGRGQQEIANGGQLYNQNMGVWRELYGSSVS